MDSTSYDVLLTYLEWVNLVLRGSIKIFKERCIISQELPPLIEHFKLAPEVSSEEDGYILCRFNVQSEETELNRIQINSVEAFFALTERGKKILSTSQAGARTTLASLTFDDQWKEFENKRASEEKKQNAEDFCRLMGVESHIPSSPKDIEDHRQINEGMFRIKEELCKKFKPFLGTPAAGYKLALHRVMEMDPENRSKNREVWRNLQVLKESFDRERTKRPTFSILSSDLYKETERLLDKVCENLDSPLFSKKEKVLSYFQKLLVIYHYASLIANERDFSLDVFLQDLKRFNKLEKKEISALVYILGSQIPRELLTSWRYLAKDTGSVIKTGDGRQQKISFHVFKEHGNNASGLEIVEESSGTKNGCSGKTLEDHKLQSSEGAESSNVKKRENDKKTREDSQPTEIKSPQEDRLIEKSSGKELSAGLGSEEDSGLFLPKKSSDEEPVGSAVALTTQENVKEDPAETKQSRKVGAARVPAEKGKKEAGDNSLCLEESSKKLKEKPRSPRTGKSVLQRTRASERSKKKLSQTTSVVSHSNKTAKGKEVTKPLRQSEGKGKKAKEDSQEILLPFPEGDSAQNIR